MEVLHVVVALGLILVLGGVVASSTGVPAPLVLLILGSLAGFAPFLGSVTLPSELVLVLFLPALLYWESLNTSLREIRANLTTIALLAVGLVIATAAVIAVIAHALGLSWPVAVALGAILSPTDATAVAAFAGRLPRRASTVLRAESLINDGTALVLYAVAVAAATSGVKASTGEVAWQFLFSYGAAIVVGAVVGLGVVPLRRLLGDDRYLANTLSVLTPFLAYLPAEQMGASGVVSVVTTGLILSQLGPRVITARMRTQSEGFWQLTTYLLNGALFVLIGFELHRVVEDPDGSWRPVVVLAALCVVTVIGTRLLWILATPMFSQLFGRGRRPAAPRGPSRRRGIPIAWAGFRGAVSLAAALALPTTTQSGAPLEGRDIVIAVTFVVILVILVVQGLSMPLAIRAGRSTTDPRELDEELVAERAGLQAELDAVPATAERLGSAPAAVTALRRTLTLRLARIRLEAGRPESARKEANEFDDESALKLALIPVKRRAILELRDAGRIDDVVMRRMQRRIDLEELRLTETDDDQ